MTASESVHQFSEADVCTLCGADGSSSLTGGSPCSGSPRVDLVLDGGSVRERGVLLSDCFPEPDDYAEALAALTREDSEINQPGGDGIYWSGGGAAPLMGVRIARTQ